MSVKPRVNGTAGAPTLEELLDFAQETGLGEVVWENGGRRISFKRVPTAPALEPAAPSTSAPTPEPGPLPSKTHFVKSPMVGTFLRAGKDRPPLVLEGSHVSPGQRLALVEAMQIPKEVIATVAGRIVKVLAESGKPVEYGQPLFEIELTEGVPV